MGSLKEDEFMFALEKLKRKHVAESKNIKQILSGLERDKFKDLFSFGRSS